VEEADLKIIVTAAMAGLVEVEHHLFMYQGKGKDTLVEVLTEALRISSSQAVAVRLFRVKRGMRRQEHATKGMVTSHFATLVITGLEPSIDFDGFRMET